MVNVVHKYSLWHVADVFVVCYSLLLRQHYRFQVHARVTATQASSQNQNYYIQSVCAGC